MKEPYQVERDGFIDQLGKNWDSAKKRIFPEGPRTRDDRDVVEAIGGARADDLNAHFAVSARETSYSVGPSVDSEEGEELLAIGEGVFAERKQAGMVVHVDRDRRISRQPQKRMPRDLMRAWLDFHSKWVAARVADVVAEAIQRLRAERSDRLAERRRTRKNVYLNGRRTKVNKSGPKPHRRPNLSPKVVSRNRRRK